MNSMAFMFMLILIAVVVVAGVYLAIRLVGGRTVDSDHTADPYAPRPEGFGSADREQAREAERHKKPNDAGERQLCRLMRLVDRVGPSRAACGG